MALNNVSFVLDLPQGRIYQHTPFHSYTMLDHKRTLTQIDILGHVVAKLTERVTIMEDKLERATTEKSCAPAETGSTESGAEVGTDGGPSKGNEQADVEAGGGSGTDGEDSGNNLSVKAKTKRA